MSYAIETKKRKFDRLLESLTETSVKQPRQPDAHAHDALRSVNIGSIRRPAQGKDALDASKRRRVASAPIRSVSDNSLINHYLPSSRAAFLERLETFRHVTKWHVPSTISINAAEWAKRGWVCADVDTVSCGSCSERVPVDLNVKIHATDNDQESAAGLLEQAEGASITERQESEYETDMTVEVYDALVKRYRDMITTSHTEGCPWRKRGCDASIQRIEGLLNTSTVFVSTRSQAESIKAKIGDVPPVLTLPPYGEVLLPQTIGMQGLSIDAHDDNAVKLAVCGWQYKEADVVECRNCFRSLGLWLYRGERPTVEHLDAVESHLEYCPWRSPETQDTELVHHDTHGETKTKFPGWALVCCAIRKHNQRNGGRKAASITSLAETNEDTPAQEQATPEQREKRMKDLMRRIKEIKKPFNVKSLLRRKDKVGM